MWVLAVVGLAVFVLAHTMPAPFVVDWMSGDRAVWHMPRDGPPTVYLTFDDGPNLATTPDLLDVLARERVHATFFLIDQLITSETAPIVTRILDDGHAIGLHSATRKNLLLSRRAFAARLGAASEHIREVSGRTPCRLFRPHAGWRSGEMYAALRELDYKLVGWGWMLWDWNWFRRRTADSIVSRVAGRVQAGDIIVMHDGDESHPTRDQRQTVEATMRLVPLLRERGFAFGTVCQDGR